MRQNLVAEFYALIAALLIVMATVAGCSGNNSATTQAIAAPSATGTKLPTATFHTATLVPTNQTDAKNATLAVRETQRAIRKMTNVAYAPTLEAMVTETLAAEEAESASHRATVNALNTAVPIPTAGPVNIVNGEALTATTQQAGISLQAVLPKKTFWAGEFVDVDLTLRNDSSKPITINERLATFFLTVVDETGHTVKENPWYEIENHGSPLIRFTHLQPNESMTNTLKLEIPLDSQNHAYALWIASDVGLEDGRPLRLENGPIPLDIQLANTTHELRVKLKADTTGYTIQVTDGAGNIPVEPIEGFMQTDSPSQGGEFFPEFDTHGHSTGVWQFGEMPTTARLWVWSQDHATAFASLRVPGETVSQAGVIPSRYNPPETFDTPQAAQAHVGVPLYGLHALSLNNTLQTIRVQTQPSDDATSFSVETLYRLNNGDILSFSQKGTQTNGTLEAIQNDSLVPTEPGVVHIGTGLGWLDQRRGRRQLHWIQNNLEFQLTAPQNAMTQDELIEVATHLTPLP